MGCEDGENWEPQEMLMSLMNGKANWEQCETLMSLMKGKGEGFKGEGKGAKFDGICHHCGIYGHRMNECRKKDEAMRKGGCEAYGGILGNGSFGGFGGKGKGKDGGKGGKYGGKDGGKGYGGKGYGGGKSGGGYGGA